MLFQTHSTMKTSIKGIQKYWKSAQVEYLCALFQVSWNHTVALCVKDQNVSCYSQIIFSSSEEYPSFSQLECEERMQGKMRIVESKEIICILEYSWAFNHHFNLKHHQLHSRNRLWFWGLGIKDIHHKFIIASWNSLRKCLSLNLRFMYLNCI